METPKERAKILFDKMLEFNDEATSTEMMVEFARLETAQLQADKEELLKVLQRIINIYPILVEEDKEELLKAKSLIKKHKQ